MLFRSEGGLENGWFNKDHGAMTNSLARMFMKLCERFGSKGNWRGYTYNDEMRSQALLQLSQVGLQFDESKSNNPFAYYTATMANSFTRVLNVEKRNQNLRDDILEMNGLNPSYTRQTENSIKAKEIVAVDIVGGIFAIGPDGVAEVALLEPALLVTVIVALM